MIDGFVSEVSLQ